MKKGMSELTQRQRDQIRALEALPDEQIDLSEAPEVLDWSNAVRGKYYRRGEEHVGRPVSTTESEPSSEVGAASPYSTGGGGTVLEHQYGALMLCHLLTRDPVPELGDDATLVRVVFQARAESAVDDLLIEGRGGDGAERWAAVAVRAAPRLVPSDEPTVKLLTSFLSELMDHWADVQSGHLRLVLASKASKPVGQLGALAAIARISPDESSFREAVAQSGRTTRAVRDRLVSLDRVVGLAAQRVDVGGVPPSELTWRFLYSLKTRELRLQAPDASDRTLAVSQLKSVTTHGETAEADQLLAVIAQLVGGYAPTGARVDAAMLKRDLVGSPHFNDSPSDQASWSAANVATADAIADLTASLPAILATAVAQAGAAEPESLADPAHGELAKKIDFARDLVNRGLVDTAREDLERLWEEAESTPEELQFRILTNLGACELAAEDLAAAASYLEQAHRLQPEDQKAISNAALAAHLRMDSEKAVELALEARARKPEDSQATAVLLQEYWQGDQADQLEELVAAEAWISLDRNCGMILAGIRVRQSRFEEAVALCRALVEAAPKDTATHLVLSECLLNQAHAELRLSGSHSSESLARLREAEASASRAIQLLRPLHLQVRRHEALVTRAGVRALRGATLDAMRDLDEVLDNAPEHPDANFTKGLLLLEAGQPAEARAALEKLLGSQRHPDALPLLASACLDSGDAPTALKLLDGTLSLESPGWDDIYTAVNLLRAEKACGVQDSVGAALEAALAEHPDDPRLLTLAAARCDHLGDPEGAESSLLKALENAAEADRREILTRLATFYQNRERFGDAADCLTEVVGDSPGHPAAVELLVCLVNSKRLRAALDWARRVRGAHPQLPKRVLEAEARILERAGDVREAVQRLQEICSHDDGTPVDGVNLAAAQFRCGERGAAIETSTRVSVLELCDDPRSILKLAQLKLQLGEEGYLEDAYVARRCGINDPDVQLAYMGLFLAGDRDWVEPETVGPGCAVLLKGERGERWWQVLDEEEEPRTDSELQPSDDLAARLLGRGQGDTLVLREGLEDLSYEIAAVQSKFVRAFQETASDFSTRFPEHTGLSSVTADDDGMVKVLQQIDLREQFYRELERAYQEGRLPLAAFSSRLQRSVLEMWHAYAGNASTRIRFGAGTEEEATEASALLREADVVVLDMLALLTVHELGLATHLRSRFPRVAVPQYVIDELQETHYGELVMRSAPAGFWGKDSSGQYTATQVSDEAWARRKEFVRSLLEFAESFERCPSYRMLDIEDAEMQIDVLTGAGVGAVYAGEEQPANRLVLVSDDLGLANFARSVGVGAVNTQSVLEDLREQDAITDEAYSQWIERLALLNYWFLRVSAEDIVRRLETNAYGTTEGTRAMLRTLEGPDCSEDQAIAVASQVITSLAGRALPKQMDFILLAVLATLRNGREVSPVLWRFRDVLDESLSSVLSPTSRYRLVRTADIYIGTLTGAWG